MGVLWSCCCGGERDGIATEPLLRDSDVYAPSNIQEQYNNPRNVSTSNMIGGDGPEMNGSLRQIGKTISKSLSNLFPLAFFMFNSTIT